MFTDLENKQAWSQCLSISGVRLPTGYYFGMSAATGDLSDHHDIIGVRFYQLDMDGVSSRENEEDFDEFMLNVFSLETKVKPVKHIRIYRKW